MNALFGRVIKLILALVQAQYAVSQDDGDSADGGDTCKIGHRSQGIIGHPVSYRFRDAFFSGI